MQTYMHWGNTYFSIIIPLLCQATCKCL